MLHKFILTAICLAAVLLFLPGCETINGSVGIGGGVTVGSEPHRDRHPGPPDHAPAHGHRKKHHHHKDVELVYDSGIGVYTVVEYAGFYFSGDFFYRLDDDAWVASANINGPWEPAHSHVPPGLKNKHGKHKKKDKGKGKGKGKNKGRGHS